jgi:hypothetical protein
LGQAEAKESKEQHEDAHGTEHAHPSRWRFLQRWCRRQHDGARARQGGDPRFELGNFRRVRAKDARLIQSITNFFQYSGFEAGIHAFDTACETTVPHACFEGGPACTAGVYLSHAPSLCKFDAEQESRKSYEGEAVNKRSVSLLNSTHRP